MREWSAEVRVDEPLVRRLIGRQFREVELRSLRLLAEGWDNAVWLVDERWVFRFPRRAIAIPGVERELAVLPLLAPLLPLPIPNPVFVGRPTDAFPWPFFGAAFIPGREVSAVALSDADRTRIGRSLAQFLRTLHGAELESDLPDDPNRRSDMSVRVPRTIERLAEVEQLGLWRAPGSVRRALDDARGLTTPKASVVAHGDLHFRHLLTRENELSGVIDWGDVCHADPSIDLLLVWSFLPREGRAEFLDAYGHVTEEQLLRARVLAFFLSAALAAYAHHEGIAHVKREAIEGLDRAAAD